MHIHERLHFFLCERFVDQAFRYQPVIHVFKNRSVVGANAVRMAFVNACRQDGRKARDLTQKKRF